MGAMASSTPLTVTTGRIGPKSSPWGRAWAAGGLRAIVGSRVRGGPAPPPPPWAWGPPPARAAREVDEAEALAQQLLGHMGTALEDLHAGFVDVLRQARGEHLRGARGQLGRLERHRVPGGQRAGAGEEAEPQRDVPRGEHE